MTEFVLILLLFSLAAGVLAVGMIGIGKILGPRRSGAVKRMPYESGMDPIHDARRRFDIRFHLVAIAFLVFDVELLFLYPWAAAAGDAWKKPSVAVNRSVDQRQTASIDQNADDQNADDQNADDQNADDQNADDRDGDMEENDKIDDKRAENELQVSNKRKHFAGQPVDRGLVFGGVMVFLAFVAAGLVYEWRRGVLRWR